MPDSEELYITITTMLPICLHLDGRVFSIPYREGKNIDILTENVFSEKETYLGSGKNVEIISDVYSHYRFTRIRIKIPVDEKLSIDGLELFDKYKDVFFEYLNRFIDSARIVLKRYGLKNYYDKNEFVEQIITNKSYEPTRYSFQFNMGGGVTKAKPNRSETEHQEVQKILSLGIPIHEQFLIDAKRALYYHDYIHALLNAVIALEIVVSNTIRNIGQRKGIAENDIKNYIRDVGLTGNIKTTIILIAPEGTIPPQDQVFSDCKSAITIRNKIMHEGRRKVLANDVQTIDSIEKMIEFCNEMIKEEGNINEAESTP